MFGNARAEIRTRKCIAVLLHTCGRRVRQFGGKLPVGRPITMNSPGRPPSRLLLDTETHADKLRYLNAVRLSSYKQSTQTYLISRQCKDTKVPADIPPRTTFYKSNALKIFRLSINFSWRKFWCPKRLFLDYSRYIGVTTNEFNKWIQQHTKSLETNPFNSSSSYKKRSVNVQWKLETWLETFQPCFPVRTVGYAQV